ncbi:hypothetical protein [Dyella mobilis]|uniref:ApeA N-terminal domain-containing protein n=1 Tax=Dyella mobilis TaxID=1849582 RepID=A0ABS2KKP5_9GAMM|nr:hypothetical protein [Dyella mobilis]MBM7130988.1 hypothetical protein [Dyella mobilis]GLQ97617.1 hypothetical protein GCM10007863_20370 [Dyella mobilis]
MVEDKFNFSKKFKYAVEVYHDTLGSFGNATLVFGKHDMVRLKFEGHSISGHVAYGKSYDVLRARTNDGDSFTLFACKCYGFACYAYYVVVGDVGDKFKAIQIRYSDVSEWFMHWQRVVGDVGEKLSWENIPDQISAHVKNDGEEFSVKTEIVGSRKKTGENYLINEHIVFVFENIASMFCAEDIKNKSHEMANLFSILLAHPISAISAWVSEDGSRWYEAYFPTFKRAKRDISDGGFFIRCFASRSMLEGKWQTLIESYYKSHYRDISWVWLAGMQRYKGFWQYKVLGYVAVLDKFVSQFSKGQKARKGPSGKGLRKLGNALKKLADPLTQAQQKEVLDLVEKSLSGTRELNFGEEYRYAIANSDSDVVQVINISKDDFKHIKKARDKIAHGDAVTSVTNDFTRENGILDKITLLLTYWAFRDFGLTKNDFLKCLTGNHSRLSLNPALDRVHLERVTKTSGFYGVSNAEFERISKVKKNKMAFCFTLGKKGRVTYSKKYTELHEEAIHKHPGKGGPVKIEDMLGLRKEQLKYWPKAYFECGDKCVSLHSCYFISE